jgi:hypothetical protein
VNLVFQFHFSSGVLWTLGFLDILASWRRPQA